MSSAGLFRRTLKPEVKASVSAYEKEELGADEETKEV